MYGNIYTNCISYNPLPVFTFKLLRLEKSCFKDVSRSFKVIQGHQTMKSMFNLFSNIYWS